ncbi:MAG: IS1634 family transposase [Rhodobacter sp.]|nr:IS1634 family transposase [Rhodobacter sp.]
MYIESVPNRSSPPAVLLRESWREGGRVRKRTIANLTKWPPALVEGLRCLLKGGTAVPRLEDAVDIVRSLPHGHVAAVLGTLGKLGLETLIDPKPSPRRDQALAMIVARILEPALRLATARRLAEATATTTLGEILDADLGEDGLYAAMDWLLERQERIERGLAERHLEEGCPVLYDLTSVWMEGRSCPLAKRGHSRDGKKGRPRIGFGLLCNRDGCPVSVEVFPGNTADPATLASRIATVRERFSLSKVVLVGDRGMLTEARIREEVKPAGLDWISALRGPATRALVEAGDIEMSLFDERDLVEITGDAWPGERLMVCRNPLLAADRTRRRQELLEATEALLEPVAAATRRGKRRLRGRERIGERVGRVIGRYGMAKHFTWSIDGGGVLTYRRDDASIAAEARLDGLYVIRTSLPETELDGPGTVRAYKRLSSVERAFRSLKTVDLKVRPVFHRTEPRVRAHVLLCMLSYYVEWNMRQKLKPMLFDDGDAEGAEAGRASVVAPAGRSTGALAKAAAKTTPDGDPVHSLRTLLDDLATITRNTVMPRLPGAEPFRVTTRPTPLQGRILNLLGVRP